MNIQELLPIGSVILLKNGKKRLMVTGVKQTNTEDGQEYDYIGVLYPEGHMGDVGQFLFNHSDVDEIYFRGFEDQEREEFIQELDKFYTQINSNG